MNKNMKRTELNDAFKRFQILPILLPKSDARAAEPHKKWQRPRFDVRCLPTFPNVQTTLQSLAE
jgi:hypothetical protein